MREQIEGKQSLRHDVDGIILIDKEKDWTSHDVCAFIRGRYRIGKVGHAGTLDPMATGLLVILIGRATKLSQTLSVSDKQYEGSIRLGIKTDSYDVTGKVMSEGQWQNLSEDDIRQGFKKYQGTIKQMPPMVSAIKKDGVRLYKLARQGKTVDREVRVVTVHDFRIENIEMPRVDFFAHVSKGTYLRTLVNDLGEDLGCYAVLERLRRLKSGAYTLQGAVTTAQLKREPISEFWKHILPIKDFKAFKPSLVP